MTVKLETAPRDLAHGCLNKTLKSQSNFISDLLHVRMLQEIESKLNTELEAGLEKCVSETNSFMKPVEEATSAVVMRLKDAERRRADLAEELEVLKQHAASVE